MAKKSLEQQIADLEARILGKPKAPRKPRAKKDPSFGQRVGQGMRGLAAAIQLQSDIEAAERHVDNLKQLANDYATGRKLYAPPEKKKSNKPRKTRERKLTAVQIARAALLQAQLEAAKAKLAKRAKKTVSVSPEEVMAEMTSLIAS